MLSALVQPTVQCKHIEFSDNEELAVYLFNGGDASVTPDVVVQYHEWSLPSPTLHFIQLAHFGKRKRRLRVESPFVAIAQEVTMSRKTTSYITANLLFKIWLMLGAFIKSALLA